MSLSRFSKIAISIHMREFKQMGNKKYHSNVKLKHKQVAEDMQDSTRWFKDVSFILLFFLLFSTDGLKIKL